MSDGATGGLSRDGWTILEDDGFLGLVGPFWHRIVDGRHEYSIEGQAKHRNRRGVVQGGLTMTLADRSCGMTARYETGNKYLATVQLDMHFIDGAQIGDTIVSRPRIIRATRSLIFMSTEVSAGDRCVATANGVFKIMKG